MFQSYKSKDILEMLLIDRLNLRAKDYLLAEEALVKYREEKENGHQPIQDA